MKKVNIGLIVLSLLNLILISTSIIVFNQNKANTIKTTIKIFFIIIHFLLIEFIFLKIAIKKLLLKSKEYKNINEIKEWANNYYGISFLEEINSYYSTKSNDPYGIGWYKGNYYWYFNSFPKEFPSKYLNEFIKKFKIDNNIITYRFCNKKEYKELSIHKKRQINKFLSTTLLPDLFNGNKIEKNNLIKIIVPKNTNGLYLPDRTPNDIEAEILFPVGGNLLYIGKSRFNDKKIKTYILLY